MWLRWVLANRSCEIFNKGPEQKPKSHNLITISRTDEIIHSSLHYHLNLIINNKLINKKPLEKTKKTIFNIFGTSLLPRFELRRCADVIYRPHPACLSHRTLRRNAVHYATLHNIRDRGKVDRVPHSGPFFRRDPLAEKERWNNLIIGDGFRKQETKTPRAFFFRHERKFKVKLKLLANLNTT